MKCSEVHTNLGALVLGGLEAEEEAEVQRHLAFCPTCRDKLQQFEEVSQALRAAPPPAAPPAHLKDEILSYVRAEEPSLSNEETPSSRDLRSKKLSFVIPGVAAAAMVSLVALGAFVNVHTQTPVATVRLTPVEEKEDYWGIAELHSQPSGNQLVELKLNNLDEPAPDDFYEAWFTSGEKSISAGSFTTTDQGLTDVWLTAPPQARNYPTLLITEQSAKSDPTPGKNAVLKGEVL
jgi:hypothetical protein